MIIDSAVSSAPFAQAGKVSCYDDIEQKILFSMSTVFRIDEIEQIDSNNRLWQVKLTLIADNDPQLTTLITRLREDIQGTTGWQ
ncbi:unnamed protein product [Rotaria sp. Silwood2]|nr:unnamed protein product [Rotaria sp. Silwood2]CAF3456763.1 unnamed protein product [Rotaria sp. Silwood2]CAF4549000.1 unnamed protein product [Rotaria sp. Silwood2]CAF4592227.1 unnamed protein product [Rotaria sp. Silwood2]